MKLAYYRRTPNFGDKLNPFLFKRILPDFFDDDERIVFLGIGSILGNLAVDDSTEKQIVFSSGYSYGDPPKDLRRFEFWCVRGPETARVLGLEPSLAIGDGALLLRRMDFPAVSKKHKFAFMPHEYARCNFPAWREIAEDAGCHYIDPYGDVDSVIRQIRQSEVLLTEAMHGAIVADVFRVPWIPLVLYGSTAPFKWRDWAASMEMEYHPVTFPALGDRATTVRLAAHHLRHRVGGLSQALAPVVGSVYHALVTGKRRRAALELLLETRNRKPFLSDSAVLSDRTERLWRKLAEIEQIYRPTDRV